MVIGKNSISKGVVRRPGSTSGTDLNGALKESIIISLQVGLFQSFHQRDVVGTTSFFVGLLNSINLTVLVGGRGSFNDSPNVLSRGEAEIEFHRSLATVLQSAVGLRYQFDHVFK